MAVIQDECLERVRYWVDTNRKTAVRVLDLMEATLRDPTNGIGKPEQLKQFGGNAWSRRINEADRLVYEVFQGRDDRARTHVRAPPALGRRLEFEADVALIVSHACLR